MLEAGEDCDDGNTSDGDGCDADCCTLDADGDGFCDTVDPCTDGEPATKARVRLARSGVLLARAVLPGALTTLDPVTNGLRLLLADATGYVADWTVPPGAYSDATGEGWTVRTGSSTKWSWRGSWTHLANVPIADKVTVRERAGVVTVKAKTKQVFMSEAIRGALDPQDLPVSFEVGLGAPYAVGQCIEARFPGPSPAPSCRFAGDNVVCR